MDTHFRGPAASGQGAVITRRGKNFTPATASGSFTLVTLVADDKNPVVMLVRKIETTAFDAGTMVINTVQPDGTTAAATLNTNLVFKKNVKVVIVFDKALATVGDVTVVAEISGLGPI